MSCNEKHHNGVLFRYEEGRNGKKKLVPVNIAAQLLLGELIQDKDQGDTGSFIIKFKDTKRDRMKGFELTFDYVYPEDW